MPRHADVNLPIREFMYTLDQIAYLLNLTEATLKRSYLHFEGKSVGVCPRDRMIAVDISPDSAKRPEWRVPERYLKRWMRFKGLKVVDGGYLH